MIAVPAHWLGAVNSPDKLRCMQVRDSSMAPTIERGSIAIIMPGPALSSGPHVIRARGSDVLLVRRLDPRSDGTVKVSCDNPDAEDAAIQEHGALDIVARIVSVVHHFLPG